MDVFAKILNVNYFRTQVPSYLFDKVLNKPCLGLRHEIYIFRDLLNWCIQNPLKHIRWRLLSKRNKRLLAVNYFRKKLNGWVLNTPLLYTEQDVGIRQSLSSRHTKLKTYIKKLNLNKKVHTKPAFHIHVSLMIKFGRKRIYDYSIVI